MKTCYLFQNKKNLFVLLLFLLSFAWHASFAQTTISNVTPTDISCNGMDDGSIVITATGTGIVEYSIDGGTSWQTSGSFTPLTANSYTVWARDDNDTAIYVSNPVIIVDPAVVTYSLDGITNVTCNGSSDGSIEITPSGGTGPYSYNWSDGGGFFSTDEDIFGLTAGTYDVTITDVNACSSTGSEFVTEPSEVTFSVNITNATCFGASDGSIEVTASSGSGTYEFSMDNGSSWTGITANPHTFNPLVAGDYEIQVRDDNGCYSNMNTETVSDPDTPLAHYELNGNADDASCNMFNGTVNGAIPAEDRFYSAGQAMFFDGTSSNINCGTGLNLINGTDQLTITAWIKPDSLSDEGNGFQYTIVGEREGGDNYQFAVMDNALYFSFWSGGEQMFQGDPDQIKVGMWQFVAVTYDGVTVRFFYNDQHINDFGSGGFIDSNNSTLFIGSWMTNVGVFSGEIDDVRIYNRPLDDSELQTMFWDGGYDPYRDVTFRVNMNYQIVNANFDPGSETVNVAGYFNCWGGCDPMQMSDPDGDGIYEYILRDQHIGYYFEYKYRANNDWCCLHDLGDNRSHTVDAGDNILEFWINEEFLNDDIGVSSLVAPISGCGLTVSENVTVKIKNYGVNTVNNFDVSYQVDGGGYTLENISPTLNQNDEYDHTFGSTYDLSANGTYTLDIAVNIAGDQVSWNDTMQYVITNKPVLAAFPHFQNFEGAHYWTTGGNNSSWDIGSPAGSVINYASSGSNAWVTNLSGEWNQNEQSYVESPCFDFSGLSQPVVRFKIWARTVDRSCAALQYSIDNGLTWEHVGLNTTDLRENWYEFDNSYLDFSGNTQCWMGYDEDWVIAQEMLDGLGGESNVRFRIVFGSEDSAPPVSDGFAFDDFEIYDLPTNDAIAYSINNIGSDCNLPSDRYLEIDVKNMGSGPISNFDVYYQIDGNAPVPETFSGTLNQFESAGHSFSTPADFSTPGQTYIVKVWTNLAGDENTANDTVYKTVTNRPVRTTYPYLEDFESTSYWDALGYDDNVTWEIGTPSGSIINGAYSGSNAYVTNLDGMGGFRENSMIESECFDFTSLVNPYIEFKMWRDLINDQGLVLQYSIDYGDWFNVGTVNEPYNWYNPFEQGDGMNHTLNGAWNSFEGWNNITDTDWITARHTLDGLGGASNVRLRFGYVSPDNWEEREGFAIDDIQIYEAPANDLFVFEISNPSTRPDLTASEQVTVRILNSGSAATSGDYAIHCYIDGGLVIDDTINTVINPGDTLDYNFSEFVDLSSYQTYEIKVSVAIPGDGFILNDTIIKSITNVPNIITYPYAQDFEGIQYWTVSGTDPSWEIGAPVGPEISYAASGSNALITRLDGYANQNEQSFIESPYFDFSALISPYIALSYWSNGDWNEGVCLQYSDDNGMNWYTIGGVGDEINWYNNGVDALSFLSTNDGWSDRSYGWVRASHGLDGLGGMSNIKLRFVGAFWGSEVEFGIDNLYIYEGDQEGGVSALNYPTSSCGFTTSENIEVDIYNYGANDIGGFDVSYQINGGSVITETYPGNISPNTYDTYVFGNTVDLSTLGIYTIKVWTDITGDGLQENDTLFTTISSSPIVSSFPYEQDFEGVHYWTPIGDNSSWEIGTPAGAVINSANSGSNAWVTNLNGDFNQGEQSWVEGPCFDFSALSEPMIELAFWRYTKHDAGAALQYSADGGMTWNQIGGHWDELNWYEDDIGALDFSGSQAAWSGWATKWMYAVHALDGLGGQPDVRLRIVFGSDAGAEVYDGFAFDDIKIYDKPQQSARLVWVNDPHYCNLGSDNIGFEIKNVGINPLDSIEVYYQIDGNSPVSEMFYEYVDPENNWGNQFSTPADFSSVGTTYQLKVWVNVFGDFINVDDTIYETVINKPEVNSFPYLEDFEGGDGNWTSYSDDQHRNNSWTFGTPSGSVINSAASGSNAWSTIPMVKNSSEKSYIESPCFDLSSLITPAIEFNMWRDLASWEHGVALQYSTDGHNWNQVGVTDDTLNWYTPHPGDPNFMQHFGPSSDSWNATQDVSWIMARHNLDGLGGMSNVKLRFVYSNYHVFNDAEGFAIDDIQIYENAFPNDAAAIDLIGEPSTPYRTATEEIKFVVKNNGINEITSIDVTYQINGGAEVTETISGSILTGEDTTYTFTQTADVSSVGEYTMKLWTSLPGDQLNDNDTIEFVIYTTPVISGFPYTEDFEAGHGYWYGAGENSSWEVGIPDEMGDGLEISSAASGSNCWATNLNGLFNDNENSYVVSPGFDFSSITVPYIELQKFSTVDDWNGGAAIQYSVDTGKTWQALGEVYQDTNWYNIEDIWAARGIINHPRNGWSGWDGGWNMASHNMIDAGGKPLVMIRIVFGSDQTAQFEGFAFDDIRVYDGTPNINASIMNVGTNAPECQPTNAEEITVDIVNRGLDPISGFNVEFLINDAHVSSELISATINPGDTLHYVFTQLADLYSNENKYSMKIDVCLDFPSDDFPDDNCETNQLWFFGDFDDPWPWTTYTTCNSDIHANKIYNLVQGPDGDIWMTNYEGVSRFDGSTWIHYSDTNELAYNKIWTIFKDNAGNIWMPSIENDSITQYDGASFIVHAVPGQFEECIFQDSSGNIWFGSYSEEGLLKYDGGFTQYDHSVGIPGTQIWSIAHDIDGDLLVSTNEGLVQYNGIDWTDFQLDGASGKFVTEVFNDKQGNIWFSNYTDRSLVKYDGSTWEVFTDIQGYTDFTVWSINQDSAGNVWFTERGKVFKYFEGSWSVEAEIFNSGTIYGSAAGTDSSMWFGTAYNGALRYKYITDPSLEVSHSNWDFGSVGLSDTHTESIFWITNNGGIDPLVITDVTITGTDYTTDFDAVGYPGMNGDTLFFSITLTPSTVGAIDETLTITSNGGTRTIDLHGVAFDCYNAEEASVGLNFVPGVPYYYTYTPAADEILTITSCVVENSATEPDTRLFIYESCDVEINNPESPDVVTYSLVADCEYCDNNWQSTVRFYAYGGTTYYIYWDPQWDQQPFYFDLSVEVPVEGDRCEYPFDIASTVVDVMGSTETFNNDYDNIDNNTSFLFGNDVVYRFNVPDTGIVSASIAGDYATMHIMEGCLDGSYKVIDYAGGVTGGVISNKPVLAGDYYIVISSWDPTEFTAYTLNLQYTPIVDGDLVLNVNMNYQISQAAFTPGSDAIDAVGSFNGWSGTEMTDVDADGIYTVTLATTETGTTYDYKFRINGAEETIDNRLYTVTGLGDYVTHWYNDEYPYAAYTSIFYEDFNQGAGTDTTWLPAGWEVGDSNGNNYVFRWANHGPRGRYSGNPVYTPNEEYKLQSTTTDNGFMMLEADLYNTLNGELDPNYQQMNSFLQSPSIDLATYDNVVLRFQQNFRFCCSQNSKLSVFVSNDFNPGFPEDAHWIEFNTKDPITANNHSENPNFAEVDISRIAGGQSNVVIRWHMIDASHYFWAIDDVELVVPAQNDLVLEDIKVELSNVEPFEYTMFPISQAMEISFEADVVNKGSQQQHNVVMNVDVTNNAVSQFFGSSEMRNFEAGEKQLLSIFEPFIPYETGLHTLNFDLVQNQLDQNPADNSESHSILVTENVYARDRNDINFIYATSPSYYSNGWIEGSAIGLRYHIANEVEVNSISTVISAQVYDTLKLLGGEISIFAQIFRFDGGGSYETVPVVTSDPYVLSINDTMQWITVPLLKDGTSEFLTPGNYLVGFEVFTNSVGYTEGYHPITFVKDEEYSDIDDVSANRINGVWEFNHDIPFIRLNLGSIENSTVYVNVDMNHQMDMMSFDPANDTVNFWTAENEWIEPVQMFDNDGDGIYSITISDVPFGKNFKYKFGINEMLEAEYAAGDTSRVVYINNLFVEINKIYNDEISSATCFANFEYDIEEFEVSFYDNSLGDITDYLWSFGDGETSNLQNPIHTYLVADFYEVCLNVFDESTGCVNEYCDIINIIDTNVVTCNADYTFEVINDTAYFNNISQGAITDYFWEFGDGTFAYVADTNHYYEEPGYYDVCLTVYDSLSDCMDFFCDVVIVDDQSTALCKADFSAFVDSNTVAFTSESEGNITDYMWNFGDGEFAFTENAEHDYAESGYYDVCLSVYDGVGECFDEFCKTINVEFQNQATCNANFEHYTKEDSVFFNSVTLGNITDYFWDFGDGEYAYVSDTVHKYAEPGYYDVCLTVYDDESGCLDDFCKVVVVDFQNQAICQANFEHHSNQDTVRFNGQYQGNISDHFWDFGDGHYAYTDDAMHIYAHPGYYDVCYTVYDEVGDCMDTYCKTVVVTIENQVICNADYSYYSNEDTVRFNGIVQGAITDYFWDFGDGHFAYVQDTMHIYDEPGYYEVCFTVYDDASGCLDEFCDLVIVTFENQAICNADYEYFSNEDTVRYNGIIQGNITDYFWDFGDGEFAYDQDPVHIYTDPGYYEVCFTAYDADSDCLDEYCDIVVVTFENQAICNANYTFYSNEDTVRYNGIVQGDITDYFWDLGDGNFAYTEDVTHIYDEPGYYGVCFTVYDDISGCMDEYCDMVVVTFENQAICNANYEYYSNEDTVRFNGMVQGTITDHFWDFGDGHYAYTEDVSHIYAEPGYYDVCYTVYDDVNDCMDKYCDVVVLTFENQAMCQAKYEYYSFEDTVWFNNTSQGDITDYFWDFGDGFYDYDAEPRHIYTEPGYYEVSLTVYDDASGCLDEKSKMVIVTFENQAVCKSEFEYYSFEDTVEFNNLSQGDITDYFWDFGDGFYAYDVDPTHIYEEPGYYEVCLTVYDEESGCLDEACDMVVVTFENQAICKAEFEFYSYEDTVQFTSMAQGSINDYMWDFGDGYYEYSEDAMHIYEEPGYYEVRLTVYDDASGCLDEMVDVVIVTFDNAPVCNANYEYYTEENTVVFDNKSIGEVTDYFWSFDDGEFSYDPDPTHMFNNPGYYEVCLTIYNETNDCMDEFCDVVVVTYDNQSICNAEFEYYTEGLNVSFDNVSDGLVTDYFWDFDDGNFAYTENAEHTFAEPGYYNVCLTIYDETSGCLNDRCEIVVVVDPDNEICNANYEVYTEGYNAYFTSEAIGAYTAIFWDFDDGTNSNQENPVHTYEEPGYYEVAFTVIDTSTECFDTRTKVVFIEGTAETEPVNAHFSFYPDNENLTVTFIDESFGEPTSWYWDFGDNTAAGTTQNPVHTYEENNYYRVCLTVTNASGNQDTYCKIIAIGDVTDASFAYFTYFADSITSTGHFRNKSRGNIVSYSWDFGDGYGSDQEHPSHTYETIGYYAVCLTTTSATNEVKTFCNDVRIGNSIENPCLFSCVWPGDANNNLEANHYDIMTIGLNFNKTGPKRDSVSSYWIGHFAQDWSNYQEDGTNNKHADCNGDGIVNFDDTLAVHNNFAYSHYYTPNRKNNAYEITVEWDTTFEGTKATAGKARARMSRLTKMKDDADIYAIGYEIEVVGGEGILFNSIEVKFNDTWLGTYGENLIGFYAVDSTKQMIYVGMSRTDQTNTSGGGHLIDIYFYFLDGYNENGISFIATSLGGIDASGLGINIGGSFSIDLGENMEACKGETITIDAGEGYANYEWSNGGSTTNLLDVTETGKYYVTVTDSTGISAIDSIVVTIHDLPNVDLGPDIESDDPITLDAGEGFAAYFWQDGSNGQTLDVTETGQYWVRVTDNNGCQNADTINVEIGVGITEMNTFGSRILVYPNPATEFFKLAIESEIIEDMFVEMYNLQGQKALFKEFKDVDNFNGVIDVSDLESGVYYLKVTKGNDYAIMKLILK